MKISDNFLEVYNKIDTLLMISSFPGKEDRSIKKMNAVASYADHLTPELRHSLALSGRRLVILAEMLTGPEIYEEEGALIVRCWSKNSPQLYVGLLKVLSQFSNVSRVFIQFEFNMFGKIFVTGLFWPFLMLTKLGNSSRNITLLLHQVILDLSELSGHINFSKFSIKTLIFNTLLKAFYLLVVDSVDKVIVHDAVLKGRLLTLSSKQVFVIPHGLGEYKETASKEYAREVLNLPNDSFVVLSFGFITWYKGSDWILDYFTRNPKTFKPTLLVLAGGKSANLQNDPFYQQYYNQISKSAATCQNAMITGFVDEKVVHLYFAACDLVALPYRTQMSASGPLAVTLSFGKPFVLSTHLRGALETQDIHDAMLEEEIALSDITFDLSDSSFSQVLNRLQANPALLNKAANFSRKVSHLRNWKVVSRKFINVIDY